MRATWRRFRVPAAPFFAFVSYADLGAPWPVLERHVRDVVRRGALAPGHVVNLGHGVPPDTDPDVLTRIVGLVHSLGDGRPRHGDPRPTTERAP